MMENNIEIIRKIISSNLNVAVITGAGVSSESGIPTFRGKDGYWNNYNPADLATPEAFQQDPKLVHEWYTMRRKICKKAKPNTAHFAIVKLEKISSDFLLITQNVDGLHLRAGNQKLIEIHGNIFRSRCTKCHYKLDSNIDPGIEHILECPECGSFIRPDIVWFGEGYSNQIIQRAASFLKNIALLIVAGTSASVSIPFQLAQIAKQNGALLVDINPETTSISGICDYHFKQKAGEVFNLLLK